jgi:hypothetical protein
VPNTSISKKKSIGNIEETFKAKISIDRNAIADAKKNKVNRLETN